ncbi:hypothetical protein DOM22_16405 [Bdellovibrio sp. ZAP7]|uniref:pre-toxin TG domain-containing protein n=1 Tax=Bdellovibrio sp. ZAP7 TaxID=2231053 RepID=UPI0011585FA6|nr:pre-toxin TG domain-containing protein [Bdellovibrio sp. ZAP7]QDK46623.1 hypothetical protein DOM22_16405 [Bdellovibrio sp. ZAP7]
MKTLLTFLISCFYSVNTFAAYWNPAVTLPVTIVDISANQYQFYLDAPKTTQFQVGQMYYFFDAAQGKWISAVYNGTVDGVTRWSNLSDISSDAPPVGTSDSPLPPPGYFDSETHERAMGAAVTIGMAHAIYRELLWNDGVTDQMNGYNKRIEEGNKAIQENYKKITDGIESNANAAVRALATATSSLKMAIAQGGGNEGTEFISKDEDFVRDLQEIDTILRTQRSTIPKRDDARRWGHRMVRAADEMHAAGDIQSANGFKKYAEAFADIAVGLDPVTGPIRDTYEAFTGKNLVTGEQLNDWERGFAILGAVTFGFGSKIARGISAIRKIEKIGHIELAIKRAVTIDSHVASKMSHELSPKNRALYEKYLADLRKTMDKPQNIIDPNVRKNIDEYWRAESEYGNGSTAAAFRWERMTGEPVKGTFHENKMRQRLNNFMDILKNRKDLAPSDRIALEHIVKDILEAIKGN